MAKETVLKSNQWHKTALLICLSHWHTLMVGGSKGEGASFHLRMPLMNHYRFLILMLLNSGGVILQFSKEILTHLITVVEVMKLYYRKLAK